MASSLSQVLSHFEFRFLLHPYFLLPAFPDLHFYFCFPFSSSDNLFSLLAKGFTSTIILPVFCCLKKIKSLSPFWVLLIHLEITISTVRLGRCWVQSKLRESVLSASASFQNYGIIVKKETVRWYLNVTVTDHARDWPPLGRAVDFTPTVTERLQAATTMAAVSRQGVLYSSSC